MLRTIITGVLLFATTAVATGQAINLSRPTEHIDGDAALVLAAVVNSAKTRDLASVETFHVEHNSSSIVVSSRGTRSASSVPNRVDAMDRSRLANVLAYSSGTPFEVTLSTDIPASHAAALAASMRFRESHPDLNAVNLKDPYGAFVTLYQRDDGKTVVVLNGIGPPPPRGYHRIGCGDQEVYLVDARLAVTAGKKCHA